MRGNTPYADLQIAITNLEKEKEEQQKLLKDQFKATYEGLKPFSVLKSMLMSHSESPELRENFFGMLVPFLAGFLSKRGSLRVRRSAVINHAAILLLDTLNRYISQNPEVVAKLSRFFVGTLRKRK